MQSVHSEISLFGIVGVPFKVLDCVSQNLWVVLGLTKKCVTVATEQGSNGPGFMVVVQVESIPPIAELRNSIPANGAAAALGVQHIDADIVLDPILPSALVSRR